MKDITLKLGFLLFLVTITTCILWDFPYDVALFRAAVVFVIFIFLVLSTAGIFSRIIASIQNKANMENPGKGNEIGPAKG